MKHGCSILKLAPHFNSLSFCCGSCSLGAYLKDGLWRICWLFFFVVFMHFNNVFSVSFREAGGKLVHTFCFLSILRHSADPHQIVPNCSTQAIFPVTIFVDSRIFKRLFLHISTNSWPCAPPHTWLATILLYTTPTLGYFFLQLICPSSACPSVWVWKSLLSDFHPEFANTASRIEKWLESSHTHTQIFQRRAQRRASEWQTFVLTQCRHLDIRWRTLF